MTQTTTIITMMNMRIMTRTKAGKIKRKLTVIVQTATTIEIGTHQIKIATITMGRMETLAVVVVEMKIGVEVVIKTATHSVEAGQVTGVSAINDR